MVKQIVAAAVIFLLLVGLGLTEMFVVRDNFSALEKEFTEMAVKIQEETLTEEEYNLIWEDWKKRRETVEFFLNHTDFAEMDFRMAECHAYIKQGNYQDAAAQADVLTELTRHIPDLLIPTPEHIL